MHNYRPITTRKIFDEEALLASGTATSVAIDLREITGNGFFSLEYLFTSTGDATIKFEYLISSEEEGTYHNVGSDIGATLAEGGGFLSFDPELAPFLKIKVTEDGAADPAVVTALLNIQ